MEQRQYFPKAQKRKMRRERIKKWFSETFRAHSKEEYKEFFTRGFDGQEKINTVYPWLYMRVLVFCFLLFAATTFFMRVTSNAISFPAMTFLGAILVNLPFITLIYELCPKTDISFLKILFVLVVGGTASVVLTELGYFAFIPKNGYASVAWTAFIEELAKIIPAIAVILITKKRKSPLTCFALAAAVGAGISIIEDMGYILFNSYEGTLNLTMAITTSIVRSISGVATHTVWVGYVGWIFSKCKRPLLDVRFYGICLMSMALHFLWDLIAANEQLWSLLGMLFGFIFCICFTRWLVKKERKLVLEAPENLPLAAGETVETAVAPVTEVAVGETAAVNAVAAETAVVAATATTATVASTAPAFNPSYKAYKAFPEDTLEVKIKKRARYSQAANIIAAIAAIMLGIIALNACSATIGYDYETKSFTEYQKQEFIDYVQNGYDLEYDWDRQLKGSREVAKNPPSKNWYSYSIVDGKYINITEIVESNGFKYYYDYYWNESLQDKAENGEDIVQLPAGWYLSDISVVIDGRTYPCVKLAVNIDLGIYGEDLEDPEEVSCFIVRDDVIGCYRDGIFGWYVAVTDKVVFYGLGSVIGYAIGMGAVIFIGALLFAILKSQSKRLGKDIAAATAVTADEPVIEEETPDLTETDAGASDGGEENSDNGDGKDVE